MYTMTKSKSVVWFSTYDRTEENDSMYVWFIVVTLGLVPLVRPLRHVNGNDITEGFPSSLTSGLHLSNQFFVFVVIFLLYYWIPSLLRFSLYVYILYKSFILINPNYWGIFSPSPTTSYRRSLSTSTINVLISCLRRSPPLPRKPLQTLSYTLRS